MKDIELPPLPEPSMFAEYWASDMQTYARAAVEADRAQRVPDVEDALDRLASDAFRNGQLWERYQGKGWPEAESAEFCNLRDDAIPAAIASLSSMLAATPAQPAQQEKVAFCHEKDAQMPTLAEMAAAPQPVERKPLTGEQASAMAAYFNVSADYVHTVYNRVHGIKE